MLAMPSPDTSITRRTASSGRRSRAAPAAIRPFPIAVRPCELRLVFRTFAANALAEAASLTRVQSTVTI